MPWTRKQVRLLLSKGSPLEPEEKAKMHGELHANPEMGHLRKGSARMKRKPLKLTRAAARSLKERARMV